MKKYIYQQKFLLIGAIAIAIICSILGVFLVQIIQKFIDGMLESEVNIIIETSLMFILVLILNFLFGYLLVVVEAQISKKLRISIKKDIFSAMLNFDYDDYRKNTVSSRLSIFENDINLVESYYFENVFILAKNSIMLILSMGYLMHLNAKVAIVLILCSIIILIVPTRLANSIDTMNDDYLNMKAGFIEILKDYLEGMDVIHAYRIEAQAKTNFELVLRKLEVQFYSLKKKIGFFMQISIMGNYLIMVISLILGGFLVINNEISIGGLVAITQIMNLILQPMSESGTAFIEIIGSQSIRKKIEDITEYKSKKKHIPYNNAPVVFKSIELRNVNYCTEDKQFSIKDISLYLEAGKKYIILGPSGCGKTTLLKIIANIIDPISGMLLMNDIEYKKQGNVISHVVSFVHQDTFIFDDTIKNNICLYQNYEKNNVHEVVKMMNLQDRIKEDIDMKCAEGGRRLSGGEKQRIGLARAILRDTPILLLDEITSALDQENARTIIDRLFTLKNKTIVLVTHKIDMEILRRADCIICMESGRIVEQGSMYELINEKGIFYKFYATDFEIGAEDGISTTS